MADVCRYFCNGYAPSEIADLMTQHHGVQMNRETPYKFLRYAASKNLLQFRAPRENWLSTRIQAECPWLQHSEVVLSSMIDDVAYRTALVLIELLQQYQRAPRRQMEVHIGFAGGHSMRRVAEQFALLLQDPHNDLPQTVVFHALTAGFDMATPLTAPNTFFTYFAHPATRVRTEFVGLHAPPIIQPSLRESLVTLPGIKEAYGRVNELDIIVTSAGVISDEHSMPAQYYMDAEKKDYQDTQTISTTRRMLQEDGCVGDMLWLPLASEGPMDSNKYPYRSMVLLELSLLPHYIRRGKQVVLALGPCGACGRTKTTILQTLLSLPTPLITHLVVDSHTARELFESDSAHTDA